MIRINPQDLLRLIALNNASVEEEEEDDEDDYGYYPPHDAEAESIFEDVAEPQQAGLELLQSGEFGRVGHQYKSRDQENNIAKTLMDRGTKLRPTPREDVASDLVPNSNGVGVAQYSANAYVGQYSSDSSFYYTCVRDFRLHVYDTTAPIKPSNPIAAQISPGHISTMKHIKTIRAYADRWTITDSHLSPDNQRMIYATVSNNVYMASTLDTSTDTRIINFSDRIRRTRGGYTYMDDDDQYGIWSCKFSADGNEIVAGGREMIFVYDLIADRRTVKIPAHEDDINSCCWADTASGNVLVSASDDTFLKVWDRRSLGSSQKPSGVLIGHTEGITYVSAKGDGRYVISNGKDQVLRLWDLRNMRSTLDWESVRRQSYGIPHWDYRTNSYPRPRYRAHPMDCSVMKYHGHSVLRTLIRCHFSPAETTGSQYIYSGSADGQIHIWSLDGRVVQTLNRCASLSMTHDPSGPEVQLETPPRRRVTVRDVSWHSQQPILMSAGWLGDGWSSREGSVIARHEWKGLSKMRYSLEDYVGRQVSERAERAQRRNRALEGYPIPGHYSSDDDEWETDEGDGDYVDEEASSQDDEDEDDE
ncbi:WD40 repeat-like protein [Panus rudis PR-1116 ss-1]|nr:WD40 repeat-like protein [Panus rudis PR-1116 ss-1]